MTLFSNPSPPSIGSTLHAASPHIGSGKRSVMSTRPPQRRHFPPQARHTSMTVYIRTGDRDGSGLSTTSTDLNGFGVLSRCHPLRFCMRCHLTRHRLEQKALSLRVVSKNTPHALHARLIRSLSGLPDARQRS